MKIIKLKLNFKCSVFLICLLLLATTVTSQTDNISGKYIAYNADTSNIVLLRLQKDSIGYRCTYDLPLAKIMNATAKNVRLKDDTLTIYLQQPIATITAVASGKKPFTTVVWKQNGQSIAMQTKPLQRLQTPHPKYTYAEELVEHDNVDKTVHLGATFTHPKEAGKKFPVAILITGSGQEDRDETVFEHRPFAVIADYLTQRGLAVLRVDDRGKGKSKGEVIKATSADFAQDVLTSLSYLKTRSDVDTGKIGLIGHSEGGIISAIAYTSWPHFAFIISLGGTGVPGSAILIHQQTDPVKELVSKAAFDAYYQLEQEKFAAFDKYYDSDSLAIQNLSAGFDAWKNNYPDSVLIPLNAKMPTGAMYGQQIKMELSSPWLKYFTHTDPALYFKNVKCPVLALNGAKDTQVDAIQNTTAIRSAIEQNGNHQVTTLIFPGLNHLFQHCQTGAFKEYALIEETFSPGVLGVINNWLRNLQLIK